MPQQDRPSESPWAPLDLAIAKAAIRWVDLSAAPAAAIESLTRGADGAHLVALAGMAGASWSELEAELAGIYPGERGSTRPQGRAAAELAARWLVEQAANEDMNGLRAIRAIWSLASDLHYPSGDLEELAAFEFTLELVDGGVIEGTRASVVADFVDACQRILAAGGPTIPAES